MSSQQGPHQQSTSPRRSQCPPPSPKFGYANEYHNSPEFIPDLSEGPSPSFNPQHHQVFPISYDSPYDPYCHGQVPYHYAPLQSCGQHSPPPFTPHFAPPFSPRKECSKKGACVMYGCDLWHPMNRRPPCRFASACVNPFCMNLHPRNRLLIPIRVMYRYTDPEGHEYMVGPKTSYLSVFVRELYEGALFKFGWKDSDMAIARIELYLDGELVGDRNKYIHETNVRDGTVLDVVFKTRPTACKFGERCLRYGCQFYHESRLMKDCAYGSACSVVGCPHVHPRHLQRPCKAGIMCTNHSCNHTHPNPHPRHPHNFYPYSHFSN